MYAPDMGARRAPVVADAAAGTQTTDPRTATAAAAMGTMRDLCRGRWSMGAPFVAGRCDSLRRHENRLAPHHLLDPRAPPLATDPALLVTAEWRRRGDAGGGVDHDGAGLDLPHEALDTVGVCGVQIGAETEGAVVGLGQDLVVGREP